MYQPNPSFREPHPVIVLLEQSIGDETPQDGLILVMVSMRPGITIRSVASITAAAALRFGPTAAIFLPSISTSAFSKSPTAESILSTMPFSRMRRPLPPPHAGTASFWAESFPGAVVPAAIAPATRPAILDLRKRRRDSLRCAPASAFKVPFGTVIQG